MIESSSDYDSIRKSSDKPSSLNGQRLSPQLPTIDQGEETSSKQNSPTEPTQQFSQMLPFAIVTEPSIDYLPASPVASTPEPLAILAEINSESANTEEKRSEYILSDAKISDWQDEKVLESKRVVKTSNDNINIIKASNDDLKYSSEDKNGNGNADAAVPHNFAQASVEYQQFNSQKHKGSNSNIVNAEVRTNQVLWG